MDTNELTQENGNQTEQTTPEVGTPTSENTPQEQAAKPDETPKPEMAPEIAENAPAEENSQQENAVKPDVNPETEKETELAESGDILGKYTSEEEYKKAFDEINTEIDEWCETIDDTNDWKKLRNRQSDLRAKIKILFLNKDDNLALNAKIDEASETINKKQNEEREKKEKEYQENYEKFVSVVDETCKKAAEEETFSNARDMLIKLQDDLRDVQLKRSQKDQFLSQIQSTFTDLNEKRAVEQENYEMECIDNYYNLKEPIQKACEFSKTTERFAEGRNRLIAAQRKIKGKKLKRDQRDELYQIIRDHFEMLNERQAAERMVSDEEADANYEKTKKIVDETLDFARNTEEYGEARTRMIAAQKEIKAVKMKREQRDELFAAIREVFSSINEKQASERAGFEEEANKNYDNLTKKVDDAFGLVYGVSDFKLIRESLINVQAEVKIMTLRRDQRNELFARIREAFGIFDKKRDEFFSERRAEKARKLQTGLENVKVKIERLEELRQKENETLESLKNDQAEEAQIQAVEKKIETKTKQIEESKKRLEDIEKEIQEINKVQKKHTGDKQQDETEEENKED